MNHQDHRCCIWIALLLLLKSPIWLIKSRRSGSKKCKASQSSMLHFLFMLLALVKSWAGMLLSGWYVTSMSEVLFSVSVFFFHYGLLMVAVLFVQLQIIPSFIPIDPFSVSKHCDVFLWGSLAGGRKSPLTASLTLSVKFVRLFLFSNYLRNSDLTCVCKVNHCPGPRLLFEKVNFNGCNQIGWPAHTFTQRIDDLTGLR